MQFKITKRFDSVTPSLRGIMNALGEQSRRRILIAAAQKFQEMTKANFGSTGRYRDKQWPPLSPAYAKKVGRTNATLLVSGALKNSIKIGQIRTNWIEIYTSNPYAAAQMLGSRKTNLPARNYWPMQLSSVNYQRPVWAAERELVTTIGRRLVAQSNGALPMLSSAIRQSPYTYGNIFTAPQSSVGDF